MGARQQLLDCIIGMKTEIEGQGQSVNNSQQLSSDRDNCNERVSHHVARKAEELERSWKSHNIL